MTGTLDDERVRIKVTGEFACFTRPDLKVERVSYPCMTPSAARGILDSILWKPEFRWYIRRILILTPVTFFAIKRNEIKAKQAKNPISIEEQRTQRISNILKNVSYIIEASVFQESFDAKNPPKKYTEMFKRRVSKGQCFRRPYLGTREFACEFSVPSEQDKPIAENIPVGSLFYDMYYGADGKPVPLFAYNVNILNGVLDCESICGAEGTLNEKLMTSSHIRPSLTDGQRDLVAFYAQQESQEEEHA